MLAALALAPHGDGVAHACCVGSASAPRGDGVGRRTTQLVLWGGQTRAAEPRMLAGEVLLVHTGRVVCLMFAGASAGRGSLGPYHFCAGFRDGDPQAKALSLTPTGTIPSLEATFCVFPTLDASPGENPVRVSGRATTTLISSPS